MTISKSNLHPEIKSEDSKLFTLIPIIMTAFITTFTGSALNLSVPAISSEFGAGAVSVGWIVTGYILASASLSVPFGRFADLYGKKPVFVTGEIIFTICAVLCSFAWNISSIIAFRLIQGIGAAMVFATNTAILVAAYPSEKRGRMLGLSVASTYLGLSMGPVIGGTLNQHTGWRSIFYITATYGVIMVIITIFGLKEPAHAPDTTEPGKKTKNQINASVQTTLNNETEIDLNQHTEENNNSNVNYENTKTVRSKNGRFAAMDITGCILYTLSLSVIMYSFSSLMSNHAAKFLLAAGIITLVLFIRWELRVSSPVINMNMFRGNIVFSLSNLAALLNYGASYAVSYLLSIYFQSVLGYSSQTAGLILITSPIFQTVLSPVMGKLSDKYSPFKLASLGMALTAAGIFMFIFINPDMPLLYIIIALSVIGIGFSLFSSPNTNAVMSCVDKKVYSVASSILATSRSIGHTASMAIVSSVVAVTVGNITLAQASPEAIISAMHVSFIVFTALCAAGILCSAKRKNN
ncbi:MAG: MFS transporter [Firmicutes bacterium]|nr:MFS transporter [Bacillota bacterium]